MRIYMVEVSKQVVGFKKRANYIKETLGEEALDLPRQRFNTVALWVDLPEALVQATIRWRMDLAGGLHAAGHAADGMLWLSALCDRNDIGGISNPLHHDTGMPQVFIYNGHARGVGIAEKGYDLMEELWVVTLPAVEECPCSNGCPGCIQSPKCGSNNQPLDKGVATTLLRDVSAMTRPAWR